MGAYVSGCAFGRETSPRVGGDDLLLPATLHRFVRLTEAIERANMQTSAARLVVLKVEYSVTARRLLSPENASSWVRVMPLASPERFEQMSIDGRLKLDKLLLQKRLETAPPSRPPQP
jgi:hypothetical protein